MKIEINKNTIRLKDIKDNDIIVGVSASGEPCILSARPNLKETVGFLMLSNSIPSGRNITKGYRYVEEGGLHAVIDKFLKYYKWKIEVFHQEDWKEALQWLIDNATI